MLFCQNCNERPGSYVFETNIGGVKKNICLCEACAKKMGLIEQKSTYENVLFKNSNNIRRCPTCNTSEEDFNKFGFVGCSDCYYAFNSVKDNIYKYQKTYKHIGKKSSSTIRIDTKMKILMKMFKNAVEQNNYFEANKIKKEIQILGAQSAKK